MKNRIKGIFQEAKDPYLPKEVIDVFFKNAPGKPVHKGKSKKHKKSHKKLMFSVASFLLLALVLSSIIIILYKKYTVAAGTGSHQPTSAYTETLLKDGVVNRAKVERMYFDGDASEKSSFEEKDITLIATGAHGRAGLIMQFRKPIDLTDRNILLKARTKYGTKKLKILVKDSKNRYYEFSPVYLYSDWDIKNIRVTKARNFDLTGIKEMKFEFGRYTAGNEKNTTIYLKNVSLRGSL